MISDEYGDLSQYEVKFQFITLNTSKEDILPQIVTLNQNDLDKAFDGYSIRGRYFKGLTELYNEIQWHKKMNIWNISKEVYEHNSRIPLKLNYE